MAKDLHTATAALAYVLYCWFTTKQTLYPRFAHNLLSRLQVRLNDVMVNNCPCFLTECITNTLNSCNPSRWVQPALYDPTSSARSDILICSHLQAISHRVVLCQDDAGATSLAYEQDQTYDLPNYDVTFALQQEDGLMKHLLLGTGDHIGAPLPLQHICSI